MAIKPPGLQTPSRNSWQKQTLLQGFKLLVFAFENLKLFSIKLYDQTPKTMKNENRTPSRREFIGTFAVGATGLFASLPGLATGNHISAPAGDADAWFKKVKGKHRIIYDASEPHQGFPVAWASIFYKTNNQTGTPDNDMTAVVVLRHNAIGLAMQDRLWEKYKFGEMFEVNDPSTNRPSVVNPYSIARGPMWTSMGIDGINQLIQRGAMFCVCDVALTVYSGMMAEGMKMKPEDIKQEWVDGLLPGIQIVPSGVWAIGRAQENGCAYCYAGG